MKKYLFILLSVFCAQNTEAQHKTENVILVTLDGMRWQEVFGGADPRLMANKKFTGDSNALKKVFNASTSEERRMKLMPFLWTTVASKGQLYGNRKTGNRVNTTNKQWFSYPGYNEILTGFEDDERINTNDAIDNPNRNVLEFIASKPGFTGKVAAFSSWETFPWIINTKRNGIPVNSGWSKSENQTREEKLLDELMVQLPNFTGDTRLDALTFHLAFEYLKKNKPRLLFISFDETDHFAHEGQYDRYLNAAHYTDGFLAQLWNFVQTDPQFKDKTSLIITTDHGRGDQNEEDWRHHGNKVQNADQIWMAIIGPDSPAKGERGEGQLFQNQVAATLSALLGFQYENDRPSGARISGAISK